MVTAKAVFSCIQLYSDQFVQIYLAILNIKTEWFLKGVFNLHGKVSFLDFFESFKSYKLFK